MYNERVGYVFYKNGKRMFGIGSWKDMNLKKPVLYVYSDTDNSVMKVASFNNWESAELFLETIKKFLVPKEVEGDG